MMMTMVMVIKIIGCYGDKTETTWYIHSNYLGFPLRGYGIFIYLYPIEIYSVSRKLQRDPELCICRKDED